MILVQVECSAADDDLYGGGLEDRPSLRPTGQDGQAEERFSWRRAGRSR
jgi:hypothetical protein